MITPSPTFGHISSLLHFEQQEITLIETLSMIGGLEASRANPKGVLILREYPASALRPDGIGPPAQAGDLHL